MRTIDKLNKQDIFFIIMLLCTLILLIAIQSRATKEDVIGISYSDLNVIYYDSDETLLHEVCHVVVDNDPEDYFNDNKLERFCKQWIKDI